MYPLLPQWGLPVQFFHKVVILKFSLCLLSSSLSACGKFPGITFGEKMSRRGSEAVEKFSTWIYSGHFFIISIAGFGFGIF